MYELGDKVIYQGVDEKVYKKHGVVKSIEEKHGKPQLTVELENGETFTAPIDDWSREFSNACTNAKFKVGDKVKIKDQYYGTLYGTVVKDDGGSDIKVKWDGKYSYRPEPGMEIEDDILTAPRWSVTPNACTSTNAVIRNAVAAKNAAAAKPSDPESAKRLDAFWRKVSALKREAEELDKFLVSRKQYGYSGSLSYIARALADD